MTDIVSSGVGVIGATFTELSASSPGETKTLTAQNLAQIIECKGSNAFTVVLPNAEGYAGMSIAFKMAPSLSALVTLEAHAGQHIDEATTMIMWAGEWATLTSTGAEWVVGPYRKRPMVCKLWLGAIQEIVNASTNTQIKLSKTLLDNTNLMGHLSEEEEGPGIVVKRAGIYRVAVVATVEPTTSNAMNAFATTKKPSEAVALAQAGAAISSSSFPTVNSSGMVQLSAGEMVKLAVLATAAKQKALGGEPFTGALCALGLEEIVQ